MLEVTIFREVTGIIFANNMLCTALVFLLHMKFICSEWDLISGSQDLLIAWQTSNLVYPDLSFV